MQGGQFINPKMKIKNISLFCVTIALVLLEVECVLRNEVTNRCIHIQHNGSDSSYNVLAQECSWSDAKRKIYGNRDQWLELTPRTYDQREQVTIGKVEPPLVCITVDGNGLKAGNCSSDSSTFIMKEVKNSNQQDIFTLEHPEDLCVTVLAGSKQLSMRRCVPQNTFQQWTVCRRIGKCDVEAFWSSSVIVFRSNAISEQPTEKSPLPPKLNDRHATPQIVISEILYYLQNELSMEKRNEEEERLLLLLLSFYQNIEVSDGVNILTQIYNGSSLEGRFRHGKTDEGNSKDSTPEQLKAKIISLINLYKKLKSMKILENVTFVSKNMSRVPGQISSPSILELEKYLTENVDNVISSLETVKRNFNFLLTDIKLQKRHKSAFLMPHLDASKRLSQQKISSISENSNDSSSQELPTGNIDIDVRLRH